MPSVIKARYHPGKGYKGWGKQRHGAHWVIRFMARAITEGWQLPPEKRADVVESLYGVTQGTPPDGVDRLTAADVVTAARALMKGTEMELAEAKLTQDAKQAEASTAAIFAQRRIELVLSDPKALALACDLDTRIAAEDSDDDPGGVCVPGERGAVEVPISPIVTESQAVPGGVGPVSAADGDDAAEARQE
jgi:hypothetical protein